MLELLAANKPLLMTCTFLFGAVMGSFLNVVIYRLPEMMARSWQQQAREVLKLAPEPNGARFNLLVPASQCRHCGASISPIHNIPLLSWLLLRSKAACCGGTIARRYPVVELLSAVLSALCAWNYGCSMQLVAALIMTWVLITAALIDKDTQLLPDELTLPLLWLALLFNVLGWQFLNLSLVNAVIGAMFGYLSLWSIYWGFKLVTGKEGMGYGDFKLLAALGAWLGWRVLPKIILLSSLVAAIVGVILVLNKRMRKDQPMPYGPYLAAAGWLMMMLYGPEISKLLVHT